MKGKVLKYQGWAIAWTIVIIVLCNIELPENDGPGLFFDGFDKLVHVVFFFILAVLLFYGKIKLQHTYAFRSLTILKIILITALIGGGIEILQWKVFTWRSGEWWDFICDMAGVFMAIMSYILLHLTHYNEKDN